MQAEINHVVAASTAISVAYKQGVFIAERIFPRCPTDNLRDVFVRYSKQSFRSLAQAMGPGAFPRTFTLDMEPYGYFDCKGWAIAVELPDAVRNHSDNKAELDLIHQDTALGIIALGKELQAQSLISTTTIPNNSTLAGASKWSDYVNSDPITAIRLQVRTIQQAVPGASRKQMKLLLGPYVFDTLVRHPGVREDIKYVTNLLNAPVDEANLAAACGIEEVIVPENIQLTSAEGQQDALSFTWGNIALLFFSTGAPSRMTPNFGYTFWSTLDSYPIKRVRNEMNDADYFKSQEYRDMILVEPNAGFLWNTPI
jgi:hypothetical protein